MDSDARRTDSHRTSTLTVALFVVCSIGVMVPICTAAFQVGVDTPTHLSILRVLRLAFEDPTAFHQAYGTRSLQPYWGYYVPALILSAVLPLDLAAKFVTGLTLIGIPIATALLAKRENLNPIVALPAFALCYNYNYWWGFLPFLSGTVALLFGLLSVLRYRDHPNVVNLLLFALASLGVFVSHVLAWLLFAASSAWLLWRARRLSLPAGAAALSVLAATAGLLLLWWRGLQRTTATDFIVNNPLIHDIRTKAADLPHIAFSSINRPTEIMLLGLWLAVMRLAMAGPFDAARRQRCVTWGGLAFMMFAGYWLLPQDLNGLSFVYERLLFLALLFPLLCAPESPRFGVVMPVALVVVAANLGLSTIMLGQFNREMQGASACLATTRPRMNLMGLMLDPEPQSLRQPLFLHVDNYYVSWRLGRVYGHSMDTVPNAPVFYRQHHQFSTLVPTLVWEPFRYQPEDGRNVDYFLIHGPTRFMTAAGPVSADDALLKGSLRGLNLTCEQGQWRLYSSKSIASREPAEPWSVP